MSNLWRHERASAAASLGSFVIQHGAAPSFRPWGSNDDHVGAPGEVAINLEDEIRQREEAAYALGLADARETVEAEFAAERDAIAQLAEALPNLRPEPTLPLAMLIAETVDRLVREIVGEVEVDAMRLLARAKSAAMMIGEGTQPARLKVNPADAILFADAGLGIEIETDESLARGEILIETAQGWIEDGPAIRLERLRAQLDQVAATR